MKGTAVPLLDVNFLIALGWPNHVHHDLARNWFTAHHRTGWATTPITEIGFVRISSNRAMLRPAATPAASVQLLRQLAELPGHYFWPDDASMIVGPGNTVDHLLSHRDVTDAHLLALARSRQGRLVTFDARMSRLVDPSTEPDLLDVLVTVGS